MSTLLQQPGPRTTPIASVDPRPSDASTRHATLAKEVKAQLGAIALRPELQVVQIAALVGNLGCSQRAAKRLMKRDGRVKYGFDRIVKELLAAVYPSRKPGKIYYDQVDPHNRHHEDDKSKWPLLRVDVGDALAVLVERYKDNVPSHVKTWHEYHSAVRRERLPISDMALTHIQPPPSVDPPVDLKDPDGGFPSSGGGGKSQADAIKTKEYNRLLFLFYMVVEVEFGWSDGDVVTKQAVLKKLQDRIELFNVSRYGLNDDRIESLLDLAAGRFSKTDKAPPLVSS